MRCPECDARVEPDDEFCPECGADLPRRRQRETQRRQVERCSVCGEEWDTGEEYCPSCGVSIYGDGPFDEDELS